MEIHKHGFIKGGLCEKRLNQRRQRAEGSRMAWEDLKCMGFAKYKNGWYVIKEIQSSRCVGEYANGDFEIGYLRMLQDCFPQLLKSKRRFRKKEMENWIEGVASLEFGFTQEGPLSIITPGEKVQFAMCPPKPNDDSIYEKLYGVKRGLVKTSK